MVAAAQEEGIVVLTARLRQEEIVAWRGFDGMRCVSFLFPWDGRLGASSIVGSAPPRRGRTSSEEQRAGREPIHNPPRLTWPAKQVPLVWYKVAVRLSLQKQMTV